MDVGAMITRLKGRNYQVTRALGAGSYSATDGSYVPGTTQTLTVMGSLQPMTAEEIVSLPEGDRVRERFNLFTVNAVKNISSTPLAKADLVNVGGVQYEVEKVQHWPNHGKAVIVRVNTDAN